MPKVEKVGHDLFSPLHYTCPTPKVQFPYLSWLHQKLPWSFFLCFFVFFLLCSYWLHLYLFFDFLKERRLKKFSFSIPTGPIKSENSHLTFLSFLLRKELGSSLESFSQVHGFTHQQKDKTHLISYSHFLKETRKFKNSLKFSTSHTFRSSH